MSKVVNKYRESIIVNYYKAEENYYRTLERLVDGVSWLK